MIFNYEAFNNYTEYLDNKPLRRLVEAKNDDENDEVMQQAMIDVDRSIAYIIGRFPFFAVFVKKMPIHFTRGYGINTMATDGKNIYINPDFVAKLNERECTAVIVHEVLHNVMQHFKRQQGRTQERWNVAADYEINPMITDEGLLDASNWKNIGGIEACYDEKYLEMPAETIYDMIGDEKMPGDDDSDFPVDVGNIIKTKDGKFAEITKINADGSYEADEITKDEAYKKVLGS